MTYDKTSRKKILTYAEEHGVRNAIRKFSISSSTISSWKKQEKEGYVKPKRKEFHRKIDPQKLKELVLEKPNLTLKEYGAYFGASATAVGKALKKLKFSFKKRSFCTESAIKKNEKSLLKN